MKISSIDKNNFKGTLNNKLLLNGLEKIADHGATFSALTMLTMSLTLRPFAIKHTPNVEKRNKQYSIANSVSSGLTKFIAVEAIAFPIEKTAIMIEKNKDKFLNKNSADFFKKNQKSFEFLSQLLKQGSLVVSAVPKSILSVYLIPIVADKIFNSKEQNKKEISFKGSILTNTITKYFNNEKIQKFSKNHLDNSKNITRDLIIAGDTLLTGLSAVNIKRSKKIEEKRKNNLIYNNILSTAFSILSGFALDKAVQKKSGKLIDKFKEINASNPKLEKYIQGINIARPAIIFALIYYGFLPVVSNFIAQKISNKFDTKKLECKFADFQEFKNRFSKKVIY